MIKGKADLSSFFLRFTAIPNQVGGPFYSILSRLFIILVSFVLFLSEIGGPRSVRRCFELYVFCPPLLILPFTSN